MYQVCLLLKPNSLSLIKDGTGGCGTFYAISISSSAFKGLTTVKQHRLVTQELKEEVANIHGLQVWSTSIGVILLNLRITLQLKTIPE